MGRVCEVMRKKIVLVRALAHLNVVARGKFKLKPEQEVPSKFLLDGKDVLAVLPSFPVLQLVIRDFVALSNDFRTMTSPLRYKT